MDQKLGYGQVTLKITGITPLIVHSGALADPLNKFAKAMKAVSGKRKKTDADLEELARLEFLGSLYLRDGKPCMPSECLEAVLNAGAKKIKMGTTCKAGIFIDESPFIEYDGPTNPDEMWKSDQFRLTAGVKLNGKTRVMRTRPKFTDWVITFSTQYLTDLLNKTDVIEFARIAGIQCGLCDWRPKFGRFVVEEVTA